MNQNEALVKSAIHDAVIRAVTEISADVKGLLKDALARETNETAQSMLRSMVDNLSIAKEGDKAVCQSPGYPTTWLSFGDGNLPECAREAVSEAVAEATKKGYLRPSMVDPLTRENSGNNTGKGVPNIEYEYHPGQKYVDFIISFKGCGAELGNAMQIMTTAKLGKNLSGLKRFILETAVNAGGKPCPPYGIGIGIGGQMDFVRGANLSKGGRSIIALHSTTKDESASKIVTTITTGGPVTTSRCDVNYIVTEYGVAQLRGQTLRERAKRLIAIAHPKFREELAEEFEKRFGEKLKV